MGVVLAAATFVAFAHVAPVFTSEARIVAQVMALRSLGAVAIVVRAKLRLIDDIVIAMIVQRPVGYRRRRHLRGLGVVQVEEPRDNLCRVQFADGL